MAGVEVSGVEVKGVRDEVSGVVVDVTVFVTATVDVTVADAVRVALGLGVTVCVGVRVDVSVGTTLGDGDTVAVGRDVQVGVGVDVWEKMGNRAANPPLNWTFPKKTKEKSAASRSNRKSGQGLRLGAALGAAGGTLRVMVRVLPPMTAAGMGGRGNRRSLVGLVLERAFSRASINAAALG